MAMSRSGHRQRLPCASLVTHLACTNTTFCSKISKYIVAAMKKDNFTKRAKPTVLGSTRSNFPPHCAPSLGNFHTGPNEDAGFAGQFRMQNCTRGRLVLESRCERIANLFQTTKIQDKIKSAPKTAPELATHWHSRGPQAKSSISKVPSQNCR